MAEDVVFQDMVRGYGYPVLLTEVRFGNGFPKLFRPDFNMDCIGKLGFSHDFSPVKSVSGVLVRQVALLQIC
ncbi:MAG: hypothetical protein KGQ58_02605 [Proteobacteria bacterium]|nr:hypothetical protein [Pseudomonadota bacterium]